MDSSLEDASDSSFLMQIDWEHNCSFSIDSKMNVICSQVKTEFEERFHAVLTLKY